MADTVITIPNDEPPQQLPAQDSQLQMAVTFGQMTEANRQLISEMQEIKSQNNLLMETIRNQQDSIQALRSQTGSISRQTETLQEFQTGIISEMTEDSESEENEVTEVIPPMETKIEIEQKPVQKRGAIAKFLFG